MTPTLEQTRSARHTELLTAAARLFSERGYHGTSMQHLAEALGLQRGSLYAHIGSKEELLYDVVMEGARRFLARGRAAAALEAPAAERLRAFLVGHAETVAEHQHAATVFLTEWEYLSPGLRSDVELARDEYEGFVRSIVDEGIASGELNAATDVRFAAILVLSAGNWMYAWYRPGGALGPTEIGNRFANLLLNGIGG